LQPDSFEEEMESTLPGLPVGSWRVKILRSKKPPGAQVASAARENRTLGDRMCDQLGVKSGLERGTADVRVKSKSAEGMLVDRCILKTKRKGCGMLESRGDEL
jgi:hypothetical protein